MENKEKISLKLLLGILIIIGVSSGISYAFFNYVKTGSINNLIVGKIYLHYTTSTLSLENAIPRDKLDEDSFIEFTIDGLNEYKENDIWYAIDLLHGDVPADKTESKRLADKFLRFTLTKKIDDGDETVIFDNKGYEDIENLRMYVETINKETTEETTHAYKLYVWISDEIIIGNTSDANYSFDEWNESFASVKIRVIGDFVAKHNDDYIKVNFDGNGGTVSIPFKYYSGGDTYGTLPVPVRDGYVFDGWEISNNTLVSASDVVQNMVVADTSVLYSSNDIPEGETKTADMYCYNGSYVFDGSNYINTGMYLFSAANLSKNFYIAFEITEMLDDSASYASLMSSHYAKNNKGFVFQRTNISQSFTLQVNNRVGSEGSHTDYSVPQGTKKVEILRIGGTLYYILNGGSPNETASFANASLAFDIPVVIGANMVNGGAINNYFKGTISNIFIKYISDEATTSNYLSYLDNTVSANIFSSDVTLKAKWSINQMNTFPTFITNKKDSIKEIYFKSENGTDLARYNAINDNTLKGDIATKGSVKAWLELDQSDNMYTLYVESAGKTFLTTGDRLFKEYVNVTKIDLTNVDTSNVTTMDSMFKDCNNLRSLDLINFDTSSVTTMSEMFKNCNNLASLDVRSFNTKLVQTMYQMFKGCSSLISLNVRSFNTSAVTTMADMFNGCSRLTSLDVRSFNTSAVVAMGAMFKNCSSLINLDLSSFNTKSVTNMGEMFSHCKGLLNLNISNFNTKSVTNMGEMFRDCESLVNIDVSSFDTGIVESFYQMFMDCSSLIRLDLSSFNPSSVTSIVRMFSDCTNLETIYASDLWNVPSTADVGAVFQGCTKLKGYRGTKISPVNGIYARIDNAPSEPGYFSKKNEVINFADVNAITDKTGNGYNAISVGTKIVTDTYGNKAFIFDGEDDYIEIPTLPASINFHDGFIIEFKGRWNLLKKYSRIFDLGNGQASNNITLHNYSTSDLLRVNVSNNSYSRSYDVIPGPADLRNVHEYRIEYNHANSEINVYRDGTLINTVSGSYNINNVERTKNYIGKSNWSSDRYFDGYINYLKISQIDGTAILWYDANDL